MVDPTALFLGPQGQNADLLERLVLDAVRDHVYWRRGFHPEDPDGVDPFRQISPEFRQTIAGAEAALRRLLARLKGSVPFHSPRYIGHMTGDTLLPAQVGYLAAMLYNPNNVAFEGSPVTSLLEREVAIDLAQLVGFDPERAWGHLCGGGTIANIQALWMFRNLTLASLASLGRPGGPAPVVLAPASHHYSWDKAVDLLGLGRDALLTVPVDERCRLDARALRRMLSALGREGRPIIAVIGVAGTTEGGAVDPIDQIIELRDEHVQTFGRGFFVHVDAAYGGYARALLRDGLGELRSADDVASDVAGIAPDVYRSMAAISLADAVTIDPHKLGFIPYPAGALVVRDGALREAIGCHAEYVNRGHEDHTGGFILEGSRPGAAAAACWLAHRVVPLTVDGYGAILRESFRAARGLCELLDGKLLAGGRYRASVLAPPDLDVVLYAFAPSEGATLETINDATERVLRALPPTGEREFALSSTRLNHGGSDAAAERLIAKLGAPAGSWKPGAHLRVVRSAVMTPFVADQRLKDFYRPRLVEAIERALSAGEPRGPAAEP